MLNSFGSNYYGCLVCNDGNNAYSLKQCCCTDPELYSCTGPELYCCTDQELYRCTDSELYCCTAPEQYCGTDPEQYCCTDPELYCSTDRGFVVFQCVYSVLQGIQVVLTSRGVVWQWIRISWGIGIIILNSLQQNMAKIYSTSVTLKCKNLNLNYHTKNTVTR